MKKLFSIVLTLSLVFVLSASVFAAPSEENTVEVVGATDGNGAVVEVTLSEPAKTLTEEEAAEVIGEAAATVVDIQEVSVPAETTFPVTITFSVDGITADMTVYCLHWNGSSWDKLDAIAGDGTVTCTFTSLSPIAFVTEAAATSPTTGEVNWIIIVGLVAIAALLGAYGFTRKAQA